MSKLDELLEECGNMGVEMASLRDLSAEEFAKLHKYIDQLEGELAAEVSRNIQLHLALTKADLIFQAAERQRGPLRYAAEDWRKEYSHLVTESKG
jgi:hypothetical protein